MVAAQKPVVAKMKQTTNKKSKHDFQNNDKEESDIEKAKNDDDKDNCKEDNAMTRIKPSKTVFQKTLLLCIGRVGK